MKYKDYYAILGVSRDADVETIKKAYRKLARKYHPDVSKEAGAEDRFKEIAQAYETLRDPEKRKAYDELGRHASGEQFNPPPQWERDFGAGRSSFDDLDLADLFAGLRAGARGRASGAAMSGRDYETQVAITLEQAFQGAEIALDLAEIEFDEAGGARRVPRTVRVRIPKGVTDGEVLQVRGKGGKGARGGPSGDLYLDIRVLPHRLFRADGRDLYVDLPIAPWEAVLGTTVELPTPAGAVSLNIPAGTRAGQKLRLAGRGLARKDGAAGHLYAVVQIVVPGQVDEREREIYRQLAQASAFDPRAHFESGAKR